MAEYHGGDVVDVNITTIKYGPGAAVATFDAGSIPPEWAPAVIERSEPHPAEAGQEHYHIRVTGGFRAGTASVVDVLTIRRPPTALPSTDTASP